MISRPTNEQAYSDWLGSNMCNTTLTAHDNPDWPDWSCLRVTIIVNNVHSPTPLPLQQLLRWCWQVVLYTCTSTLCDVIMMSWWILYLNFLININHLYFNNVFQIHPWSQKISNSFNSQTISLREKPSWLSDNAHSYILTHCLQHYTMNSYQCEESSLYIMVRAKNLWSVSPLKVILLTVLQALGLLLRL